MHMITLSSFRWVPPFAQGFVRDFRVRWALEEAGLPYEEVLITSEDQASAGYRALQPFGQVPAIEVGDLKLFESGAIVLYIAEQSEALMAAGDNARWRTSAWVFAALNSVEPAAQNLVELDLFHAKDTWAKEQRPARALAVARRLDALEKWLGDQDYLERRFTAGDLMMADVLRLLGDTDLVSSRPVLRAYGERCQGRPAFKKAMADHLKSFKAPASSNDGPHVE